MLPQRAMPTPTYMTIVPTRTSPLARRIYGTPGERSPKPPHTSGFERAQDELLRQGHAEYQELAMLRSGQRLAHQRLTQRPATAAAALGPGPPARRSCSSPRPTSGRALATPPRTAVVSSHVDVFSTANYSKSATSRPVTHEGRRRPHVSEEEVGAAERAMWRRELATVQQALAESEARLQRLQAAQAAPAHAAHSAATHSVPRAVNVHRAGPARLTPGMVRHRATQVIAKGRLEHEAMRSEVEADLQRMWRGLKVRPAPPLLPSCCCASCSLIAQLPWPHGPALGGVQADGYASLASPVLNLTLTPTKADMANLAAAVSPTRPQRAPSSVGTRTPCASSGEYEGWPTDPAP